MQLRTDATSDRWLATLRELDRDGSVCQTGITADDSHDCHGSQDADSGSGFSLFNVAAGACREIVTEQNDRAAESLCLLRNAGRNVVKELQDHYHDHDHENAAMDELQNLNSTNHPQRVLGVKRSRIDDREIEGVPTSTRAPTPPNLRLGGRHCLSLCQTSMQLPARPASPLDRLRYTVLGNEDPLLAQYFR